MKNIILLTLFLSVLGCSPYKKVTEEYGLEIISVGNSGETRHVKFNKLTGETWWSENTVWKPIADLKPIPQSRYLVKIISTGKSWRALRINTLSGETWKNSKGTWVRIKQ